MENYKCPYCGSIMELDMGSVGLRDTSYYSCKCGNTSDHLMWAYRRKSGKWEWWNEMTRTFNIKKEKEPKLVGPFIFR